MLGKARKFGLLWRYMGPGWLAYRLRYAAAVRTGRLRRRTPLTTWERRPLTNFLLDGTLANPERYLKYRRAVAPRFFFTRDELVRFGRFFPQWDKGESPVRIADDILKGTLRYFSHTEAATGFPPAWHRNPFTGRDMPSGGHWSEVDDFGSGDIKIVWEPSRFAFAYTLVRAYHRARDERYAEAFWGAVEDWGEHNPPQQGANWKCGQEASFRLMAWCFGLYGLLDAEATTPARVAQLATMMAVTTERIAANIEYALSQRNNHGVSEGVGLWTTGALFPELRGSVEWRARGREVLETCGGELIYDDGSFSQHSMNYHRVMLHDYVWALRLGHLLGDPFSDGLKVRVTKAAEFLYQVQDDESGRVPCYGQNDGALILPLDNCDYQDYRPAVAAAQYLAHGTRCYEHGAWDEALLWLFGEDALTARVFSPERTDLRAEVGGYYTLRSKESWAFTRCAEFRDRPAQADMLHLDLWWRGQNIAADAGTYSYNAPPPWNNALSRTAYHNTITVDGLDQMDQAGRFLWLPWLRGRVSHSLRSASGFFSYLEGEHDGYRRLAGAVKHRRGILRLGEGSWLVLDGLQGTGCHQYRLHWLFPSFPYDWDGESGRLAIWTPAGPYHVQVASLGGGGTCSFMQADDQGPRGWRAPYYMSLEPALSVDMTVQAESQLFWTLFSPEPCRAELTGAALEVEASAWKSTVSLNLTGGPGGGLITGASVAGTCGDRLEFV